MDILAAFGLFAVAAMIVCYALEDQSPWFILAFAERVRSASSRWANRSSSRISVVQAERNTDGVLGTHRCSYANQAHHQFLAKAAIAATHMRAASGHAAAAPPRSVMKARRSR